MSLLDSLARTKIGMSVGEQHQGDLYASERDEVRQPDLVTNLSDSDQGSDLDEIASPTNLEITRARLYFAARENSVNLPNSSIRLLGRNQALVVGSSNVPSQNPLPPNYFASLGYNCRVSIPAPDPVSFFRMDDDGGIGSSGALPSTKVPVLGNDGSPLSFDKDPPSSIPHPIESDSSSDSSTDESDSSSSSSSSSGDELSDGESEDIDIGSAADIMGSGWFCPVENPVRSIVAISEVGEGSDARKKKGTKKSKSVKDYKSFRKSPIGTLRSDAEQNDDKLIPICSSSLSTKSIKRLHYLYEIPVEYEIIIPGPSETLYNPPEGCLTFHTLAFECGWRIPMLDTIADFFIHTSLCPTQVLPHALGTIMCFAVILKLKGESFTYQKFLSAFSICSSRNSCFYFFNQRPGLRFLDGYESSHSSKWLPQYFYVKHPSKSWDLPCHFRRDKFQSLRVKKPPEWRKSLKTVTVMMDKSDIEEGEFDKEEVVVDAIGMRSRLSLEYDPDPGLEYEKMAVFGVDGADPKLFYPYSLVVQPQLRIAGLTTKDVYCNNKPDLSEFGIFFGVCN